MLGSAKIEGDNYEIEDNPFANYPDQEAFCKIVEPIITAAQKGYMPKTSFFFQSIATVYTFIVRDIPAAIEKFKEAVQRVAELYFEFKEKVKQFINDFKELVQTTVKKVKNWYDRNFNKGYKYATANPQIKVDTYKLVSYAQRLQSVNRRISTLDRRLDGLYWKVGLLDLWDLMKADIMTGYSWRLLRAASYLNDTASDFNKTETELTNC